MGLSIETIEGHREDTSVEIIRESVLGRQLRTHSPQFTHCRLHLIKSRIHVFHAFIGFATGWASKSASVQRSKTHR